MTEEAKEMRVKLTRFACKLLNAAVLGAFSRWAEMAEEAKVGLNPCRLSPV